MTTQAVQSPAAEIEAKSTPPLSPARRGFLASAAAGIAAATAGATASANDKFHQNRDWTGNHPVTYPEPALEMCIRDSLRGDGQAFQWPPRQCHLAANLARHGTRRRALVRRTRLDG